VTRILFPVLAQVPYRTTLALASQIQCITYRFDTGSYSRAHSTVQYHKKKKLFKKERILITPSKKDFYLIQDLSLYLFPQLSFYDIIPIASHSRRRHRCTACSRGTKPKYHISYSTRVLYDHPTITCIIQY